MIPENLQDRNVRRFKGFTPQQVEKLLAGKGFKPNSREAAEYLGAMAERAEEMLQKVKPMKAYQGASVGFTACSPINSSTGFCPAFGFSSSAIIYPYLVLYLTYLRLYAVHP